MTIYLLRHGETELNVARILQPADTPLSARGMAQSLRLGNRMSECGLVGVLTSHLPRALQTANQVAQASGLQFKTSALLEERNFGDLRGLPYDELGFNPLLMSDAPAGGESALGFSDRVAMAWHHIIVLRASMNGPLAVVTHGMVIREMLLRQATWAGVFEMPSHLGNTSVSAVEAQHPYRLTLLNCTRHLDTAHMHNAGSLSGG
jgi:2,3-bisphosphoglycerate-dependent phosphoglycerate mutase